MRLLVSGCSVTHGAELDTGFMSKRNIELSYSQHLADRLGLENTNVAMSAGSNAYIFNSLLENIYKYNDIHSVIVMWTTPYRFYHRHNSRHFLIRGDFVASFENPEDANKIKFSKRGCRYMGDNQEVLDKLSKHHEFFVDYGFDERNHSQTLQVYKKALQDICNQRDLKFIDLSWQIEPLKDALSDKEKRHPNVQEHKAVADWIYNKYYTDFA